ncbi:MAG: trigger factor [Eubacteriales bacterium]|nr:trigger factor [Eubacteriales bacterium]
MRKKIFSVVLAAMMAASLTACGKGNDKSADTVSTVNKEIKAEQYAGTVTDNASVYRKLVEFPEYKGVEVTVDRSLLEVSEQDINDYIDTLLQKTAKSTVYTEGTTQTGDLITLDYSGKLDGEAFSGGTATDATYTVGSGQFIPDLDKGLAGLQVGQEYDIPCTFPEDYSTSNLAGKDVIFTVKVSQISRSVVPELTDSWVEQNASTLGIEAADIAGLKSNVKTNLEEQAKSKFDSSKYSAVWEKVKKDLTPSSYPQEELDSLLSTLKKNIETEYNSYGSAYGVSDFAAYLSSVYGFESEDAFNEYAEQYSKDYLFEKMFVTIVAADNNIVVSADDINETGTELASYYGYTSYQDILDTYGEEMNAEVGYEVLYKKVVEFICENAVEIEG